MKKTTKTTKRDVSSKLAIRRETMRNLTTSELMHVEGGSSTHQGSTLHIDTGGGPITQPPTRTL